MNPVAELLRVWDIYLDVDAADKAALLERAATLLAQRSSAPAGDVLQSLLEREKLGSTGLGHGVAIPHARMTQCTTGAGVLLRTRTGIAFDAPDHRPVTLFLALLVPKQAADRHLRLLAGAAAIFSDKTLRDKLKAAPDPAAVVDLLRNWDETAGGVAPAG
jgi:PTS system nitrogen regulatory IIA component